MRKDGRIASFFSISRSRSESLIVEIVDVHSHYILRLASKRKENDLTSFYTYQHTHHSSNPLQARQSLRQTLAAAVVQAVLYVRQKELFAESIASHLHQACVRSCKLDYPPHHDIVEK